MNFSVQEALRLGMARQGGRESMYGDLQQRDQEIVSGQHMLQLAEHRANDTQRRMNVNILQDLGKYRTSNNLYALADQDNDVRFFPSMGDMGNKLRETEEINTRTFWPRNGLGLLRNETVQGAITHGRLKGIRVRAPHIGGTTNVYDIPDNNNQPSGYTLLKISTMEEIAAELRAIDEAEDNSDDDNSSFMRNTPVKTRTLFPRERRIAHRLATLGSPSQPFLAAERLAIDDDDDDIDNDSDDDSNSFMRNTPVKTTTLFPGEEQISHKFLSEATFGPPPPSFPFN